MTTLPTQSTRLTGCLLGMALLSAVACRPTSATAPHRSDSSTTASQQRDSGNAASMELIIPPEITNGPMPAGLDHFPNAPAAAGSAPGDAEPSDDQVTPAPDTVAPTVSPAAEPAPAGPAKSPATGAAAATAEASGDWPQWGGSPQRNSVASATTVPTAWNVGETDPRTGKWIPDNAENIRWVARLGSQTYGTPVIAQERVLVATNNGAGYLKRYPPEVDLGCLLCFRESDGTLLWQHSNEKLPSGPAHDWPDQGVCCAPLVEGERVWYVSNRGEVVCLDLLGFADDEDDGPVRNETSTLFTLRPARRDETPDPVAAAVAALDRGELTAALRTRFSEAGMPLPPDATVTTKQASSAWTVQADVEGVRRTFQLAVQDNLLQCQFQITVADRQEADVVWRLDMMKQLGVLQHNMCSCCVTAVGDVLFVSTSNGVDEETHEKIPAPDAPSFIALDKHSGEVYWTDNSPGTNILHGQWSSPAAGVLGGVPQVIFAAGDGWVYSFRADRGQDGKPTLLWKFDTNPKQSRWRLGGAGDRNNIIATPVIHDGLVYIANGQDPEYGEGPAYLWCIDPTRRGDVSPQLAVRADDHSQVIPPRRVQAVIEDQGEEAIDNPNSAAVWGYRQSDLNNNGEIEFEEELHRTLSMVAIKNDVLLVTDFSGLLHCLHAKTGQVHWTYDLLATVWGSPTVVNDHVYIGDEDGDVAIFKLSTEAHEPINEIYLGDSLYSTPVVANGTLYIASRAYLFAIRQESP